MPAGGGVRERSEWEEANFFMKWTFSCANIMINKGIRGPHQSIDDLMLLSENDLSKPLVEKLISVYNSKRNFYYFLPRLIYSLLGAHKPELIIVHALAALEGATRISSPVVLNYLLQALSVPGSVGRAASYKFAGILGILHLIQTGVHHILFFLTMRMGWQWKTATTGMIFNSLFKLKGINTVGTGKLVNLISNDVAKFEEFAIMAPFLFISMFELAAILIVLIFQLNIASAFAGIGITIMFIPIQIVLAKLFAKRRTNTAHQTDLRIRYTSELIDGIATVKSYAWENPFFALLLDLRSKEMECIKKSQTLRSVNQGLFYCIPWVAGFATFSVFWATGGILTLPIVFSTLALLQQLRTSIGRQWTRSIETGSEAIASAIRIESFLSLAGDALTAEEEREEEKDFPSTLHPPTDEIWQANRRDSSDDLEQAVQDTDGCLINIPRSSYYYSESAAAPSTTSSSTTGQPEESSSVEPAPVLTDVQLSLKRGELVIIAGPVGAGKSSLLSVILGEMKQCAGQKQKQGQGQGQGRKHGQGIIPFSSSSSRHQQQQQHGRQEEEEGQGEEGKREGEKEGCTSSSGNGLPRIAYCAQRPWILASSVKSNISIAGKLSCDLKNVDGTSSSSSGVSEMDFKSPSEIEEELYALAVESTQVVADLLNWPDYDNTEIGERGISISGGQKARIALARAVYSDADVVLLDDPLSAVDARVGSLIFFECIMKALRGRGKGVILATHQLQYMRYADRILALDKDGHQIFYGAYSELQEEKEIFAVLSASVEEHTADDEEGVGEKEKEGEGEGEEGRSSSPWRESEKASRHAHDDIPHPVDKPPSPDLPPTYDDPSAVPFTATQRLSLPTVSSTCTPSTPPSIGSPEISNPSTPRTITPCAMYLDASARTCSPNTLEAIFSQSDAMMDDHVFVPIFPTDAAIAAPLVVPQRMTPTATTTTTATPPPPPALRYDIKLSTRGKVPPPDISVKKSLLPLEASASLATKLSPDDGHIAGEVEEVETKSVDQIIVSEDRVEGRLSLRIWRQYFRAGGVFRGSYAVLMAVVAQVLLMITEYWVRWWAGGTFYPERDITNLGILGGLTGLCIFIGFYRAITWFDFTLAASSNLHEKSLWAVLHSPLQFFISNPTGRILNRFTKDQSQADESLPITLFDTVQCVLYCIAVLLLICISIPYLIIMMPFLIYLFNFARDKYLVNSIEIKRLEAISRSPIYVDFSSALEGLVTLRGYGLENAAERSFQSQLNRNSRAWFSFLMVSRWLGFRLDLESSVLLIVVVFVGVALRDTIDVGLIGFTIVYTLSLSGLLQWTVRQMAEVETQMTSIERISMYADLPPEAGYSATLDKYHSAADTDSQTPHSREKDESTGGDAGVDKKVGIERGVKVVASRGMVKPYMGINRQGEGEGEEEIELEVMKPSHNLRSHSASTHKVSMDVAVSGTFEELMKKFQSAHPGSLQIQNMTVKYREDFGTTVLNSLNIAIPGGSKVGVIGRTGCGKSSLLLALLRLNIIVEGDVVVDGQSLLGMDLEHSRSLFSVIPQDPHLFSGTVRFNLDPFGVLGDREIWDALESAHIKECVESDPLGLLKKVEEGGLNFSVGQRQLLSLARAILRKSCIVLMDEVTASIDYATDRLIQKTIRSAKTLKDCTIISVAHRIRTVADSDIVIVMATGGVVGEIGAPLDLLDNPDSMFHQFAKETNEFKEVYKIASNSMSRSSSGNLLESLV